MMLRIYYIIADYSLLQIGYRVITLESLIFYIFISKDIILSLVQNRSPILTKLSKLPL